MKVLACVLAAGLLMQPADGASGAARLFDRGATWSAFLSRARAQRSVWRANAARTDVPPGAVERLKRVRDGLRILVVAEDWCVDSAHTVPYIANLAAAAGVDLRIVDRTAGEPVMRRYPTRDGRPATPVVVLLRGGRDAGAWIERPEPLQQMFFAMATDQRSAKQFAQRAAWYDTDRGRTTIAEILALAER